MDAVLKYEKSDNLYFFADEDGTVHYYKDQAAFEQGIEDEGLLKDDDSTGDSSGDSASSGGGSSSGNASSGGGGSSGGDASGEEQEYDESTGEKLYG